MMTEVRRDNLLDRVTLTLLLCDDSLKYPRMCQGFLIHDVELVHTVKLCDYALKLVPFYES